MHLPVRICHILIWLIVFQLVVSKDHCCAKLEKKMLRDIKETCSCKRKLECPFGFIRFKGVCYWFIMGDYQITGWWRAQNVCKNHGGNLVTVNDKRREIFIHNYLEANFLNTEYPIKIFTGLIFTDSKANSPHVAHHSGPDVGDSMRWTATGEYIKWRVNVTTVGGRMAKWSPHIQGDIDGPGNTIYLSCVVIIWDPRTPGKLTWRYNDCSEQNLTLICEVRLGRSKYTRPKRSPSPHYSEVLGLRSQDTERTIGGNEYVVDNNDDEEDENDDVL